MKTKKKAPLDREILHEKKIHSYKYLIRDTKHGCHLASSVRFNKKNYIVAVTTSLFVYLINKKGKIKKVSWRQWEEREIATKYIEWSDEIKETINYILKKIRFETKKKHKKKIKRYPAIKRTPVKKEGRK